MADQKGRVLFLYYTVHACAAPLIRSGGSHEIKTMNIDSEGLFDFSRNLAPPKITSHTVTIPGPLLMVTLIHAATHHRSSSPYWTRLPHSKVTT